MQGCCSQKLPLTPALSPSVKLMGRGKKAACLPLPARFSRGEGRGEGQAFQPRLTPTPHSLAQERILLRSRITNQQKEIREWAVWSKAAGRPAK